MTFRLVIKKNWSASSIFSKIKLQTRNPDPGVPELFDGWLALWHDLIFFPFWHDLIFFPFYNFFSIETLLNTLLLLFKLFS